MYFLAYLIKNIHKVNIVGPMDKNVRPKRYGGPCIFMLKGALVSICELGMNLVLTLVYIQN